MNIQERMPPSSEEDEQHVLACMLMDDQASNKGLARFKPADFYYNQNQDVFTAMQRLRGRAPINTATVRTALNGHPRAGELREYVIELPNCTPTTANFKFYADKVAENARRRQLIRIATETITKAYDPDAKNITREMLASLLDIQLGEKGSRDWKRLGSLLQDNFEQIEAASQAEKDGNRPVIVNSGFPKLDEFLTMAEAELIIVAARTGFGKTVLAFQIACNVARNGLVGMFTMEMTDMQMARRLASTETGVTVHRQMTGSVNENEWDLLAKTTEAYLDHKVYIKDQAHITVAEMTAECRRLEAIAGERMSLVVVDYLTLASVAGKTGSEVERASQISRSLKLMAGELRCPVVAVAQFNRGVDKREGRRPELQDLKASGSIEQDASTVLFIHRQGHLDGESLKNGPVEVIVAKNRHGATGSATLHWNADRVKFENHAKRPEVGNWGFEHDD